MDRYHRCCCCHLAWSGQLFPGRERAAGSVAAARIPLAVAVCCLKAAVRKKYRLAAAAVLRLLPGRPLGLAIIHAAVMKALAGLLEGNVGAAWGRRQGR